MICTFSVQADELFERNFTAEFLELEADKLYQTREIPGNLNQALNRYIKVRKLIGDQSGVEWKITRCYWILADQSVSGREKTRYLKDGIRYGKLAIKNDPDNSDAHLWNALIIGLNSIHQGVVRTLYNRETIKQGLEKSIQLNPRNTNAFIGLANWYFHVPKILGGGKAKALQLIEKAILFEPNYSHAYMVKADFLVKEGKIEEAARVLKKILTISTPAIRGDTVVHKYQAKKVLNAIARSEINPSEGVF